MQNVNAKNYSSLKRRNTTSKEPENITKMMNVYTSGWFKVSIIIPNHLY